MSLPCRQERYLQRFYTLARLFTAATDFTTFVVDINGKTQAENMVCNPFCALMMITRNIASNATDIAPGTLYIWQNRRS